MLHYIKKCIHIYIWNILQWVNRHILKTYFLIEDCARCKDCGRNVHDFHVPDWLWQKVIDSEEVWCYDCFADKSDKQLGTKWRIELVEKWNNH